MPDIQFGCPRCGAIAQIDASMAGRQSVCPGCGVPVIVPFAPPSAGATAPVMTGPPPVSSAPPGSVFGRPTSVFADRSIPPAAGAAATVGPPIRETPPVVAPTHLPSTGASRPAVPLPPPPIMPVPAASRPLRPGAAALQPIPSVKGTSGSLESTQTDAQPLAVRSLSREERLQRRFQRNLIMAMLGITILVIAMAILLRMGGG